MKNQLPLSLPLVLLAAALVLGACAGPTTNGIQSSRREATAAGIAAEVPGNYWIGRRYYKPQFKVWGYVRHAGQPWSTSKLIMMNEKQKLAPDREANK
ncbi:MAG: hypothetical protein ABI946_06390, partial [Chthoniobacterales bacterium]